MDCWFVRDQSIDGNARQMASQVALAWRTILTIRLAKDSIWEKALTPAVLNDPQQKGTIWAACVLKGSCGSFRIGSPTGSFVDSEKLYTPDIMHRFPSRSRHAFRSHLCCLSLEVISDATDSTLSAQPGRGEGSTEGVRDFAFTAKRS